MRAGAGPIKPGTLARGLLRRLSSSPQSHDEERDPDSDQNDARKQERPTARGGDGERSRHGENYGGWNEEPSNHGPVWHTETRIGRGADAHYRTDHAVTRSRLNWQTLQATASAGVTKPRMPPTKAPLCPRFRTRSGRRSERR